MFKKSLLQVESFTFRKLVKKLYNLISKNFMLQSRPTFGFSYACRCSTHFTLEMFPNGTTDLNVQMSIISLYM